MIKVKEYDEKDKDEGNNVVPDLADDLTGLLERLQHLRCFLPPVHKNKVSLRGARIWNSTY
jgi:hypothetical protein